PQQSLQRARTAAMRAALERLDIAVERRLSDEQLALFRRRPFLRSTFAARRSVLWVGDARIKCINEAAVSGDLANAVIDLHVVFAFSRFHLPPDEPELVRNAVAIGSHADVAFSVNDAMVQGVDVGHVVWQRFERMQLLGK